MLITHAHGWLEYDAPDADVSRESPHLTFVILDLSVHFAHRGKGVGSWLLTELKRLHPDACIGVYITGSSMVRRFYEQNGFTLKGLCYAEYSPPSRGD